MIPFLRSNYLLKQLKELKKTAYLLDYWFIMKVSNSGTAIGKRFIGEVQKGPGCRKFSAPVEVRCATLRARGYVHQPRSSPNPVFWEILWKLHQVGIVNHGLNLLPPPLPAGQAGSCRLQPPNHGLVGLSGDQLSP